MRVLRLPFNCRSDIHVKALKEGMGDFIEIEEDYLGQDRYRRIILLIDVTKPSRRNKKFKDRMGAL